MHERPELFHVLGVEQMLPADVLNELIEKPDAGFDAVERWEGTVDAIQDGWIYVDLRDPEKKNGKVGRAFPLTDEWAGVKPGKLLEIVVAQGEGVKYFSIQPIELPPPTPEQIQKAKLWASDIMRISSDQTESGTNSEAS